MNPPSGEAMPLAADAGPVLSSAPPEPTVDADAGQQGTLLLAGHFLIATIEAVRWTQRGADLTGVRRLSLRDVAAMDTAGAWFVETLVRRLGEGPGAIEITDATPAQHNLLETVRRNMPQAHPGAGKAPTLTDRLERLGRRTWGGTEKTLRMIGFLGQVVLTLGRVTVRPRRLRGTALVHHMQEVGLNAVPIISLMAFLIGVVLAFQGAAQLRQFGAEVFVVDLIAISVLRELGILLTAIIVAGRSGAAFTAAIGSMKMREEIDAMRTLGLDPIEVLVVPRVMALILMLPVLGFVADVMGLIGGALMSWIELGVSPGVFQSRLVANTDVWHFAVGLIKAPFFALIIGIVGCYEGMQVEGNAESLGRLTSTSVVLAIFVVMVADAMFSIFFAIVGV